MEEHRLIKAGAVYDVDSLIKMAHEYESYHSAIPTKDIQTVYQVASMAPRKSPMEIMGLKINSITSSPKCPKTKDGKQSWKKSSKWQLTPPATKSDLDHWIIKVIQTSNILPVFELLAKTASKRSKMTTS
jgi:hypothetical protein